MKTTNQKRTGSKEPQHIRYILSNVLKSIEEKKDNQHTGRNAPTYSGNVNQKPSNNKRGFVARPATAPATSKTTIATTKLMSLLRPKTSSNMQQQLKIYPLLSIQHPRHLNMLLIILNPLQIKAYQK